MRSKMKKKQSSEFELNLMLKSYYDIGVSHEEKHRLNTRNVCDDEEKKKRQGRKARVKFTK